MNQYIPYAPREARERAKLAFIANHPAYIAYINAQRSEPQAKPVRTRQQINADILENLLSATALAACLGAGVTIIYVLFVVML